jgi:type IV secretion system protein VirB10
MSDFGSMGRSDPRTIPTPGVPTDDGRPVVAARGRPQGPWLIVGGAILLGALAFLWLSAQRSRSTDEARNARSGAGAAMVSPAPPPPELALEEAAGRGGAPAAPAAPPAIAIVTPPPAQPPIGSAAPAQRLTAPALVVDLAEPDAGAAGGLGRTAPGAGALTPKAGGSGGLNGDEQFADRVSGAEPERASATLLRNRSTLIAQGATITGVLETALDSDLPGYARAVVSRDVRSFDGSQTLIPRGSRVIGQYKSAVAQGQKRAFVIWTRIIRPDGASIQIGSSGTDPLGRAGLAGKVDTHFLERFSGAILLSVIDAGLTDLSNHSSTQIVIGSSQDAASAGLSALVPTAIPPTIKVAQGTAIRIFVARDLDFLPVEKAAP